METGLTLKKTDGISAWILYEGDGQFLNMVIDR